MKQNVGQTSAPLISWDVFMNGYQKLMQKGDDLQVLKKLAAKFKWAAEWDFHEELVMNDSVIVVTDTSQRLVFGSSNIIEMTGYKASELMGKKPSLLQGAETDKKVIGYIRGQVIAQQPFEATIVNYRKDGTSYNCHIKAFPVFDGQHTLVHFIAFEKAA